MINVLIVEDEVKICQLIKNLINWEELGFSIIALANDGISALKIIEEQSPDIVITDIRMPGCDGLELIKRAKKINKNIDFIIISGYRHFDYAHDAIKYGVNDYLLKPIKKVELLNTLQKLSGKLAQKSSQQGEAEKMKRQMMDDMEKLRKGFLVDILFNNSIEKNDMDITSINEQYHFSFKKDNFQVVIIKADVGFEENNPNLFKLLNGKTIEIIEKYLKPICHDMLVYSSNHGIYCIINYDDETKKVIRQPFRAIIDELVALSDLFHNLKVTIGAGEPVSNMKNLETSIKGAREALNSRITAGTGKVIEAAGLKKSSLTAADLLDGDRRKQFMSFIEVLDKPAVAVFFEELKKETAKSDDLDGSLIIDICNEIVDLFIFVIKKQNFSFANKNNFLKQYNEKIYRCSTLAEVFDMLSGEITAQIDAIIEEKQFSETKLIRQAKQYMQKNYSLPISLDEVSNIVGFNPTYFSYFFKKETGMNFLEYLTELRVSRAKELLVDTKQSVADIGISVGYLDLKHFSKLFKKMTGLNPSEYRKFYQ